MGRRILIVEDDKDLVWVYKRALERNGYETICAYNGKEGLKALQRTPTVDLIILDLKMPRMNGDKFLKIIRQIPEFKNIKVLVMSSVLYEKEYLPLSNRTISGFKHTEIAQRVKTFANGQGNLEIQEKLEPHDEDLRYFHWPLDEPTPKFKRRISVRLIEMVNQMLAEKK